MVFGLQHDYLSCELAFSRLVTTFADLPSPRGLDPLYFDRRRSLEGALKWAGVVGGVPSVCVDVGANEGQTLSAFLGWWPTARCISFEPHPTAFSQLECAAAGFGQRAVVRQLGVSDQAGTLTLNVSKGQSRNSSFRAFNRSAETVSAHRGLRSTPSPLEIKASEDEEQVDVAVTALDDHCEGSEPENDWTKAGIDVLKSDTQGWELNVLRGASRVLARTKVVLVEWQFDDVYGTPPPLSQLDLTLVGAGFRFWDVAHVYKDLTSLRTLWVDLIYARPADARSR